MKPTIEQTILVHQRVGKALSMLEARMADLGITEFLDELHDVRDDYDRMADSLSQGQRDPSGGKLYASLLKRTYRLYNNVRLSSIIRKYPVLTYCRKAAEKTVGEGDVASLKRLSLACRLPLPASTPSTNAIWTLSSDTSSCRGNGRARCARNMPSCWRRQRWTRTTAC